MCSLIVPSQYEDLSQAFNEKIAETLPKHSQFDCAINLKRGTRLTRGSIYPMSPNQERELITYLKENLRKGFIRKSNSSVSNSLVFRKTKEGKLQVCVDYHKLKKQIVKDDYPIPTINNIYESCLNATVFTRLNIKSAFNSIRIRKGDEYKTAFNTKFGVFEYQVMPQGLPNGPSVLQSYLEHVLEDGLNSYVRVYMDDILIYSQSMSDHTRHVRNVLCALIRNHLVIKLEKCEFHKSEIKYLGNILTKNGVKIDPEKVQQVKEWPVPTNEGEVQSFIGYCNYFRRFISHFSDHLKPINNLIRKDNPFNWDFECQNAFENIKCLIEKASLLYYPNPNKQYIVNCNSNNYSISASLSQENAFGDSLPIYYFSRALRKPEFNYTPIQREMLALKQCFAEWCHLLKDATHKIKVYTDFKDLESEINNPPLNRAERVWKDYLKYFNYEIVSKPNETPIFCSGLAIVVNSDLNAFNSDVFNSNVSDSDSFDSDMLYSNVFNSDVYDSDDFDMDDSESNYSMNTDETDQTCHESSFIQELKYYYDYDSFAKEIIYNIKNKPYCVPGWVLEDGILKKCGYNNRIYVPPQLRRSLIQSRYNNESQYRSNLTCNQMYQIIIQDYWWKGLKQDLKKFYSDNVNGLTFVTPENILPINGNSSTNSSTSFRNNSSCSSISSSTSVDEDIPWKIIYFDFIKNFDLNEKISRFNEKPCIMVVGDNLTKMVHFIGFDHIPNPEETSKAFLSDIVRLHGPPSKLFSSTPVRSSQWKKMIDYLDACHYLENKNKRNKSKEYVIKYLQHFMKSYEGDSWIDSLSIVESCFNNNVHPETNQTPFAFHRNSSVQSRCQVPSYFGGNFSLMEDGSPLWNNLKHILKICKYEIFGDREANSNDFPIFKNNTYVWLKKPTDYKTFPLYKVETRKFGPFKIINVDRESNCYYLDFYESPFPDLYPLFHASELEPYESGSKFYPTDGILDIVDARCRNGKYEYLIETYMSKVWVDANIIEDNNYNCDLLCEFHERLYNDYIERHSLEN